MTDYEQAPFLKKDGRVIRWPRVTGVAVEQALKLAEELGVWGLTAQLLMDHCQGVVRFAGVEGRRGQVSVKLKDTDASLGITVVQKLAQLMHSRGLIL